MMFLKRNLRSRMDLFKSDVRRDVENKQFKHLNDKPTRSLSVGQNVLARNYRTDKWQSGRKATRTGSLLYTVGIGENTWRRHVDQIRDAQVKSKPVPSLESPDLGTEHQTRMDLRARPAMMTYLT
ncbi:hypothetical protein AAFF_G00223610 [Aldrovandia affinis]|uniref:Uncharacterized protein n=1 Tax=Aldrovandia affinis TaxID=143900 RepID=A0AAD7TB50_9TELE|nr:hypothetical protein AAFF_G00223610 [Aldrovandia affinis]